MGGKRHSRIVAAAAASSLALAYLGDRWGELVEALGGPSSALVATLRLPSAILALPLHVSDAPIALLAGIVGFSLPWVVASLGLDERAQTLSGREYGSARRGRLSDGRGFADTRDPRNNTILTRHLGIATSESPGVRRALPNRNVLVIGGPGSGKTARFVEPNVLQLGDQDIVVTDTKGMTLRRCGQALAEAGCDIRVFNTVDQGMSDQFNPFAMIRGHADIPKVARAIIDNTNGGRRSREPIWDNGEELLLETALTLLYDWFPPENLTMANVIHVIDMIEIDDEGHRGPCPLEVLLGQIETGRAPAEEPPALAGGAPRPRQGDLVPSRLVRRDGVRAAGWVDAGGRARVGLTTSEDRTLELWHEFNSGAARTLRSFLISIHTRLAQINQEGVLGILASENGRDDMDFEHLGCGERRRVTFIITSDYDTSLNALLALVTWQAASLPVRHADATTGSLPRPVHLVFDEFRNIGRLPNFPGMISTVRSRNISISVILQDLSQLVEVYGEHDSDAIRACCTTLLYLSGSTSLATAKPLSEEFGTRTITKLSSNTTPGTLLPTTSRGRDVIGRAVYTPDEIMGLARDRALVRFAGEPVIEDAKSAVWEHPLYDDRYMFRPGRAPKGARYFDYVAWRAAGRPTGAAAARWADAYWSSREYEGGGAMT
ncbi:VirD4-like conjugal transfer protein, CD1115 family [Olsenella profusa]|uniref:TraM recognition site of TraD and TraG n=1 Tax=Olsenella profusa F0195 TaxID=1125712 RepID=U2T105_9ACTN|nr:type IV secretory system conjugative DNA transfer family protein [Olsenella profusa]ERL06734.1 TraM recognition site of TraD and TraG [Olsenella profusa F0195]